MCITPFLLNKIQVFLLYCTGILASAYQGEIPEGYFVMHSSGYRIWAMMRGFNVGGGDAALKWFEDRLKVYPLAEGAQKASFVNASKMGANTLLPEDGTAYLTASKDKEKNWIKTDPDKGFFVVFRFYGPLEGYIDKTWVLNDFGRL